MKFKILIVDDEQNIRKGLAEFLEMEGYNVVMASDGDSAYRRYQKGDIDLVITDLKMPGISGNELLRRIKAETPGVAVIILTGHGTVHDAVQAMKEGAWDFLTKPVQELERLKIIVQRALANRERRLKNKVMEEELAKHKQTDLVVGNSLAMRDIMDAIGRAAPTKTSILITGESGVGKELVANAIHNLSPRRDKPLIKVHCVALAESILESELFGHEKGSFTGADSRQRGKFELANGGTLFLDEIGEINQNIQIKLLRVIQEKKFERVGGEETIEVDIRIVAATNKDLKTEIKKGNFREDLYYRLNVVSINIPPLRERREDIRMLVLMFLKIFCIENKKDIKSIDSKAISKLNNYDWPGNIRELRNCIEDSFVMSKGDTIMEEDLPLKIRLGSDNDRRIYIPYGSTLAKSERIVISQTLVTQNGNKSETARILGIGRKTLHRKINEYGLEN
ncbi:MAG: sigma-54 dependent transcriptional regulator [Spirochaetaceae bacterium]|jgi:DNA-binding NtrC family response regulator|nr:sigma-54 dependent transcriptional regulator [Spirochaetaceae bacterium]